MKPVRLARCGVRDRARPGKAIDIMLKDLSEEIRRFHISVMPRDMGPGDDGRACYLC
jgi:hypothetical protein